jgi:hypothetical protein
MPTASVIPNSAWISVLNIIASSPLFAIARRGAQSGSSCQERTVLPVALNRKPHEYGVNSSLDRRAKEILSSRS